MKSTYFILFLSLYLNFNAQNPTNYFELYPNEDVITISLNRHIKIIDKKGKLFISEEVTKTNYFITDSRLTFANESVDYNTFNTIKKIEAQTLDTNQKNSSNNIVQKFEDKDVLINGIFFNDQKRKSFTYPNVKKGVYTLLKYTKEINDPHFLPSFIVSQNIPVHKGEFSISFPNNIEISYKTFNLDTINTHFEKTHNINTTTLKWTINSIPKINRHYDLSPLYYIPQIVVFIKSHMYKGVKTNILSNPKSLYEWYRYLISHINKTDQNELQKITEKLIAGTNNDEEKIKRIYYYIQHKINYIAFEDGLNGFVPRDAINVYLKKYGDCKDMANLLNEMLHYANIPSYLTWIGTRKKPYSYYNLPTPITDNHMITSVKLNDKYIFLDATAKYLTYGLPSPFIQGKEALIGVDENNFDIVEVPIMEPAKNKTSITSILSIDMTQLALEGTHYAELTGYEKLKFLHKLEGKDKNDLSFLNTYLKFATKKTFFENIEYKNISTEETTLNIDFTTRTNRYLRKIDSKLYVKPNLDFNLKSELVKNEAKGFDKDIEYKYEKYFSTILLIPENYTLEDMPESIKFVDSNMFNYTINYKLSKNKKQIEIEKFIQINTLRVAPEKIENWNIFIKSLNKTNKHNIILKKQ